MRVWAQSGEPKEDTLIGPPDPMRFMRHARKQIREWRPDAVHAHAHWYALAAGLSFRGTVAPRTVFTIHTDWEPSHGWWREILLRRFVARADTITTMSPGSLETFRTRFPNARQTEVVRPGVEILHPDPATIDQVLDSLGIRERFPKLCAVSMMVWPEKVRGLQTLIQSLPAVLRDFPLATLILVGDGPLRSGLERTVAELGLLDAVRFVGARANPIPFFAAADIITHVSLRETLAQSVAEGLAVGRPVIVNEEIARNFPADRRGSGIVATSLTADNLSKSIVRLAANGQERKALGDLGPRYVATHFSWKRSAEQLMQFYGLGSETAMALR